MPKKHGSTTNMVLGESERPQDFVHNQRNMMKNSVTDIIERFQTHHALQEERELEKSQVSTHRAAGPPNHSVFDTDEVRVSTFALPAGTEWLSTHDGSDRLIITLGKIDQLLARAGEPAFPARWTWVPANSDFKVANGRGQTRHLLVVEFNEASSAASTGESRGQRA
jgi:hypothetical protein